MLSDTSGFGSHRFPCLPHSLFSKQGQNSTGRTAFQNPWILLLLTDGRGDRSGKGEQCAHRYWIASAPAATLKIALGSVNPCNFSNSRGPLPSSLRITNFRGLPSGVIHTSCVRLASRGVSRALSSRRMKPQLPGDWRRVAYHCLHYASSTIRPDSSYSPASEALPAFHLIEVVRVLLIEGQLHSGNIL